MKLGEYTDYKKIIKDRVKEMQSIRPGMTLKRVAERIPIQYTYLSKVLNGESTHFSEDHLYQMSQILEFYPQESDYILLLRAYQSTENAARKQLLYKRIQKEGKTLGLSAELKSGDDVKLRQEMSYLMDPFCSLVYVGLHIPHYKQDPKKLCAPLGLSLERMKAVLTTLAHSGFIEMGSGPFHITQLNQGKIHYERDHPLTRMHQHLLGIACQNQILKIGEEDKENLLVTFTSDEKTKKKIQERLKAFIADVEKEVSRSKDENVYQLNLQFFKWG